MCKMSLFSYKDPIIFSGTIRINLDPFNIYKDDQLWLALEHAHLKEFVTQLKDQLSFNCNEGGENLRYNLIILFKIKSIIKF